MYKFIANNVIAFDAEWVPDPASGRRVYDFSDDLSDDQVIEQMWLKGGATPEDPKPYLKTVLCRIVSLAAVIRERQNDNSISLKLHSVPRTNEGVLSEHMIISRFLEYIVDLLPQLKPVGFEAQAEIAT